MSTGTPWSVQALSCFTVQGEVRVALIPKCCAQARAFSQEAPFMGCAPITLLTVSSSQLVCPRACNAIAIDVDMQVY